jgi:Holliday junction resolvase RusA-like endonuclease
MILSFVIRGNVTSNNRAVRTAAGTLYKSKETKAERQRIGYIVREAMARSGWTRVKWFKTTWRYCNSRKDLDNCRKLVLDAMNGLCIEADRYHLAATESMWWDDEGPRTEVTVEEASPTDYGRKPDRAPSRAPDAAKLVARRRARKGTPPLPKALQAIVDRARSVP